MENNKPTVGEWAIWENGKGDVYINTTAFNYSGSFIATMEQNNEQFKANAAHIVKCVNAHEELVKALKDAQKATMYLIDMTETGVRRNMLCDMNINLSMALQKVPDTTPTEV